MGFTVGFVIVCFNVGFVFLIRRIAEYRKFTLRIERGEYIISVMPVMLFLTNAIAVLLCNFGLGSAFGLFLFNGLPPDASKKHTEDLGRRWYIEDGGAIFVAQFFSIFFPHLIELIAESKRHSNSQEKIKQDKIYNSNIEEGNIDEETLAKVMP